MKRSPSMPKKAVKPMLTSANNKPRSSVINPITVSRTPTAVLATEVAVLTFLIIF
jgi:hypothetical protein